MLNKLQELADVAIWSAAAARNTVPVVKEAFPDTNFQFVWHRDHTEADKIRRQLRGASDERVDAHSVIKDLGRVYHEFPGRSAAHTVVVDDTIFKGRGQSENVLLVPSYSLFEVMCESATYSTSCEKDVGMPHVVQEENIEQIPNHDFDGLFETLKNDILSASDVRKILPMKTFLSEVK